MGEEWWREVRGLPRTDTGQASPSIGLPQGKKTVPSMPCEAPSVTRRCISTSGGLGRRGIITLKELPKVSLGTTMTRSTL